MQRVRYVQTIFVVATTLIVAACSGKPSEGTAKQAFATFISQNVNGAPISVESFKKTNGQDAEVMGTKVYTLYFSALVSFPEGYRPECVSEGGRFTGFNCMLQTGLCKTAPIRKDAQRAYQGTIPFEKSEKGWLAGQPQFQWQETNAGQPATAFAQPSSSASPAPENCDPSMRSQLTLGFENSMDQSAIAQEVEVITRREVRLGQSATVAHLTERTLVLYLCGPDVETYKAAATQGGHEHVDVQMAGWH